jgi:predicted Zn-dependent protease
MRTNQGSRVKRRSDSPLLIILSSLCFAATFIASCASGGFNIMSKSDDVQLGTKMRQQIAADPKHYPVLNNPTLTNYVQSIENRIASSPNVANKDFHYTITIINDPNTINAFTIPAGGIYIYTGLLKFIDDESALAGVLAHETTHADHRHATRNLTQQYGLQMVSGLAFGNNPGMVAQIASTLGTELSVLRFSRDDEREADQGSFDDLNQLPGRPWFPGGVNSFLKKSLAAHAQQPGQLQQMFLTHPVDQQRIDAMTADLQKSNQMNPSPAQLNQANYQRYKAMVP